MSHVIAHHCTARAFSRGDSQSIEGKNPNRVHTTCRLTLSMHGQQPLRIAFISIEVVDSTSAFAMSYI